MLECWNQNCGTKKRGGIVEGKANAFIEVALNPAHRPAGRRRSNMATGGARRMSGEPGGSRWYGLLNKQRIHSTEERAECYGGMAQGEN